MERSELEEIMRLVCGGDMHSNERLLVSTDYCRPNCARNAWIKP